MHKTEYEILNLFKKNPSGEYSTDELIKIVYNAEAQGLQEGLAAQFDKSRVSEAKRKKAVLHRRLLHHLNKLVAEDILKVTKEGSKGKKYFGMALAEGEEFLIERHKKRIIIERPAIPAMPIDGYEKKEIIYKFEAETWLNRVNSILIDCSLFETFDKLYSAISEVLSNVNDAIGLNNFEGIVVKNSLPEFDSFFEKISHDGEHYGKKITILINVNSALQEHHQKIIKALEKFAKPNPECIDVIFEVRSRGLEKHSGFFKNVAELFIKSGAKLHIKNSDLYEPPYILGRAGPYTFSENDWTAYKKKFIGKVTMLVCSQTTVAVDVEKFFSLYKNPAPFREMVMNTAKSLFSANSIQRRKSEEMFHNLIKRNRHYEKETFFLSRNYIRFWNYGWKDASKDQELVIDLISSLKNEVDNFCKSQEIIYFACGMPTRFNIGFSCAFKKSKEEFSDRGFQKLEVFRIEDLYSKGIKSMLEPKERIFQNFDGGDRVRFFRKGKIDTADIAREVGVILNTYKLPFFCYDFKELAGPDIKLTDFIS